MVAHLKPQFGKRNVKVIGLSVDPLDSHAKWAGDIAETQGAALNFPLLADGDRKVALLYDMIHPQADATFTVRSVFIIDPKGVIRLILTYPAATGRNFRDLTRHRLVATHGLSEGRDARELERGRRGGDPAVDQERRGGQAVPAGLSRDQAVPTHDEGEEVVARTPEMAGFARSA